MKAIRLLFISILALSLVPSVLAKEPIDEFRQRLKAAVEGKNKAALLDCFNFQGIDADVRLIFDGMANDILGWKGVTVEVTPFDDSKQKEWNQGRPDVNGTPSADVSFTAKGEETPKLFSMIAGSSQTGFLILLSNRRINGDSSAPPK